MTTLRQMRLICLAELADIVANRFFWICSALLVVLMGLNGPDYGDSAQSALINQIAIILVFVIIAQSRKHKATYQFLWTSQLQRLSYILGRFLAHMLVVASTIVLIWLCTYPLHTAETVFERATYTMPNGYSYSRDAYEFRNLFGYHMLLIGMLMAQQIWFYSWPRIATAWIISFILYYMGLMLLIGPTSPTQATWYILYPLSYIFDFWRDRALPWLPISASMIALSIFAGAWLAQRLEVGRPWPWSQRQIISVVLGSALAYAICAWMLHLRFVELFAPAM
ncbi:hypothetical protein [Herpetosiphon gulosus]|uniref:ABC transporter permease n=1 Tax=Herpetosiphon gulosus TaxID=1973496 RepID=A0ABP9X4Q5_9CHLR